MKKGSVFKPSTLEIEHSIFNIIAIALRLIFTINYVGSIQPMDGHVGYLQGHLAGHL